MDDLGRWPSGWRAGCTLPRGSEFNLSSRRTTSPMLSFLRCFFNKAYVSLRVIEMFMKADMDKQQI